MSQPGVKCEGAGWLAVSIARRKLYLHYPLSQDLRSKGLILLLAKDNGKTASDFDPEAKLQSCKCIHAHIQEAALAK